MKPVGFDWDDRKAASNLEKHGVSFEERMSVFDDTHAAIRDDPDHSVGEHREVIVGYSNADRLLLVSFTERNDVVRIISARAATKREQTLYEETKWQERTPTGVRSRLLQRSQAKSICGPPETRPNSSSRAVSETSYGTNRKKGKKR